MTPGKFLRLVWPDAGYYCIAHPFKARDTGDTIWKHYVFASIGEAVTHVLEHKNLGDIYFAVLSLTAPRVDNPKARKGYSTRIGRNMAWAKCSFFDLDVGPAPTKYASQKDALEALLAFVERAGLPMPTLLSSGGGVHVYWPYADKVSVETWSPLAEKLKRLAGALGLRVDPMRTTDTTSVLRVSETFNWKDRANPRPVAVLQEGAVTPFEQFSRLVDDALVSAGESTEARVATKLVMDDHGLGENTTINDFGPPPRLEEVAEACAQVRAMIQSQADPHHEHYGPLDNPAWYGGFAATLRHVEDGENWVRKLTALHPRTHADVDAKLLQLAQFQPARCETLRQKMPWGDKPCLTCRWREDPTVPNPLAAARKSTPAPPPVIQLVTPDATLESALIPNAPKPFERLKSGGIARTGKNQDGHETTEVIYPHDLYPVKRLVNDNEKVEQQLWRVHLPRVGAKDFTLDADVLYDSRKFCASLAHNGIYPKKANIPYLQDYMVAYISQLQKDNDADTQCGHLGWTDGYRQFVLPDKTLLSNGRARSSALSTSALRSTQFLTKAGTLAEQIELMRFWSHPGYIPNQVAILGALGSILFPMTGHHGIVVNMSGDAGAAKSTTLYAGASLWGHPKLWPINGTNRGATANGRSNRVLVHGNLPTCVDEITHIPAKEAIDLVMNITQPGHRIRLEQSGVERVSDINEYKSAIMLASANSSLHSLISLDNSAGTAGSMRVFEMRFAPQYIHTKAQADDMLEKLEHNFGHIGEQFAAFIVTHYEAVKSGVRKLVREIDAECGIAGSERFWSAYIAVVLVTAEIAKALGLLSFDPIALRRWLVTVQVPYMRGVVREEYRDPLAILTDYIATSHANIVVIERTMTVEAGAAGQGVAVNTDFTLDHPSQLLGHYDRGAGVLYLLKQSFKDYCNRTGASCARVLDDLATPRSRGGSEVPRRIITERAVRRTLGAGTRLAKGQAWCFAVDMRHPEISELPVLEVIQGGKADAGARSAAAND